MHCSNNPPPKKKTDLQITTQKTKDRATRTPLKTRVNSCAPEGLPVPAPHLNFIQNFAILLELPIKY
jgi:hypothetical protein